MNIEPNVRRITGPSCNFITALTRRVWAFSENNKRGWQHIKENDVLVLHQIGNDFKLGKKKSSVIGFAIAGADKGEKDELWWADEIELGELTWRYWIDLKAIYFFGDPTRVDNSLQVHEKSNEALKLETNSISLHAVPMFRIQEEAVIRGYRRFPVNGSTSKIDENLLPLILELAEASPIEGFEDHIDAFDTICHASNEIVSGLSSEDALEELKNYKRAKGKGHHKKTKRTTKERIEDQRQKLLVSLIEEHRCQICEFYEEYFTSSGKRRYIIDIDHIHEKQEGGGEEGSNLWALCPNCHRMKSAGVIKFDPRTGKVTKNGIEIVIFDNHLKHLV